MILRRRLLGTALLGALLLSACGDGEPDDAGADGAAGEEGPTEDELAQQQEAEERAAAEEALEARSAALAGPSEDHRDQASGIVAEMSLEERAGQVLMGEYSDADGSEAAELIEEHHLAGVIVMGHNVPRGEGGVDVDRLAAELETIRSAGGEDRAAAPMVSIDQEGGLVTRAGAPLTEWPAPMAYGAGSAEEEEPSEDESAPEADTSTVHHGHRQMAAELAETGFQISFAPNADVTVGASDPTIGSRSFSSDPGTAADLALSGIRGLAEGGLAGSVKHFPGHGSVSEDSHYTLPVQDQTVEELRGRDWVPFAEAADAGVPMVMMGHIEVPDLDPGVPSSLSEAAYEEVRQMGHEGVIVTDAMNMGAIAQSYGGDQAVVDALAAGADLLLMPASAPGAHAAIIDAVESGEVEEERLGEAAERVVALSLWQEDLAAGELDAGPDVELPEEIAPEGGTLWDQGPSSTAEQVAAEAVTLVEGECEAPLADDAVQVAGGTEQDRARFTAAAEAAGLQVGWGPLVTLLGGSTPSSGDIVVAVDRPEALADSQAETKLGLYGRSPESFAALVEVIQGAAAPGRLPVSVGEHDAGSSAC
ncbi:glycoside hydrolase family 3 N-terminal domain-containing protein [Nesterenkonia populi]|uniref:glycoside hydrolase family 3 N-terminal domain-containing protein n=1 Tax=Nesterenkonia populi TaxID=1591087 RepID=UPI001FE35698|nr:glycoside hydrolase family 3 N-terminal domain-containing protein [Nesterenkonia populi]